MKQQQFNCPVEATLSLIGGKYKPLILWHLVDCPLHYMELQRQGCEANHIRGSVGADHVHLLLSCPTTLSASQIMQYLKGRSSRILQDEYPILKKKYWGQHMWGRGYFCGTVWEVDQKTIEEYIKNQGREDPDDNFTIVP